MMVFVFVLTFVISFSLTGIIRRYVLAKNILDIPNDRSSHQIPTPRGGGISIVVLFALISFGLAWKGIIPFSLLYALSGGILIAVTGWLDDVISVPPLWRILVHTIAAIWAVYWLKLNGSSWMDWFAIVSIVWCVNLYNFMDGIDGLAGIEGLFISLAAGIALVVVGMSGMGLLCFLLAAAILGFLVWNWPPAKIFMGDVGSGYLGFVFAVLAFATANLQVLSLGFWFTIAAVFLCDATFTVLKRMLQGKRWYEAHREHAYQRLVQYGASHKKVTIWVLLVNVLVLGPVAVLIYFNPEFLFFMVSMVLLSFFVLWILILNSRLLFSKSS